MIDDKDQIVANPFTGWKCLGEACVQEDEIKYRESEREQCWVHIESATLTLMLSHVTTIHNIRVNNAGYT